MLYPLSYGGVTHASSEWAACRRGTTTLVGGPLSHGSLEQFGGEWSLRISKGVPVSRSSEQAQVMFPQELCLFPEPVRWFRDKQTQPEAHSCIRLVIDVSGDGRTYDRGLVELACAGGP